MCMTPDEEVKMWETLWDNADDTTERIIASYERMEKRLEEFQAEMDKRFKEFTEAITNEINKTCRGIIERKRS